MNRNRATIYSNGIADFQRVFEVTKKKPLTISLPVRQQHLADVLGSLTVSGDVRIERPPSFEPENRDQSNLRINVEDALVSLASQLGGAEVAVKTAAESFKGQLIGMDGQQSATGGEPISVRYVVVMSKNQIRRVPVGEIEALSFPDPEIQSEIDKALSRSLRNIKPNSTFVDIELSTEKTKTDAIVQYTIPAAAWKMSYRIMLDEKHQIELHGHAIVDNNTDEDWNDFIVSVVMGQPITFGTDIAESKIPERGYVEIVQQSAIGNVEFDRAVQFDGLHAGAAEMAGGAGGGEMLRQSAPKMKMARVSRRGRAASAPTAEVEDAGDFCIFQSAAPVSIDAHHSASIPVFATTLDDSTAVLSYRTDRHAIRPFRAIRFTNSTDHSLGRGVCTVYDGTTYAGTCVLPASKPGDTDLVAHALETGVRVHGETKPVIRRRTGIKISDGVAIENTHVMSTTSYVINSSRDEAFPMVVDHVHRLGRKAKIECQLVRDGAPPEQVEINLLPDAVRVEFSLLEQDVVAVTFVESDVQKSRVNLAGGSPDAEQFQITWLFENMIESNSGLPVDQAITKCIELQKLLDEKTDQVRHAKAEIERLAARQERLRKNVQSGGPTDQLSNKWRSSLSQAEDAIVQLEDERIPELETAQRELRQQLYGALNAIAVDWIES